LYKTYERGRMLRTQASKRLHLGYALALLFAAIALVLVPAKPALAATPVATIIHEDATTTDYENFYSAMDALASNETLQLNRDFAGVMNFATPLTNVTIDLNGHTFSAYPDPIYRYVVGVFEEASGSSITIQNGTLENANVNEKGVFVVNVNGTAKNIGLALKDLTIATGTYTDGVFTPNATVLTSNVEEMNNTPGAWAVYLGGNGDYTIDNCNVIATATAVEFRNGALTVTGDSTLTSTAEKFISAANGNGTTTNGAALSVSPHDPATDAITVNVESGTFTGPVAFADVNPNQNEDVTVEPSISGGTFNGAIESDHEGYVTGGTFNGSYPVDIIAGDSTTTVEHENGDGTVTYDVFTVYSGNLSANGHIENLADRAATVSDSGSLVVGTTGQGLRLEGAALILSSELDGSIEYRAHVENDGWQNWVADGELAGTLGRGLRMEALEIKLTGDAASKFNVYYRVHVENYGWLDWAANGESAGTVGQGLRVEALEVMLLPIYESAPATSTSLPAFIGNEVKAVASIEGTGTQTVNAAGTVGTTGEGKKLTSLALSLGNTGYEGGIEYSVHVENNGWLDAVADGQATGKDNARIEAITATLTGDLANYYHLEYRAHVENIGWLGWTAQGEVAGTTGQALRLEAIEFRLVNNAEALSPAA
jgi:uncharacterized protein YjdB